MNITYRPTTTRAAQTANAPMPMPRLTGDAWGLPNPGHFSRLFRAAYGVSPRDSRG